MSAHDDTIFALSSGAPPAAIAIVRVSGPGAADVIRALAGLLPPPRMATLRRFAEDGEAIDRGLLLWFPAAASVTGEDLAELHVHGGRAVVARLLAAIGRVPGTRAAESGEFSRRAALNGRLPLGEAEALADLLAAETEVERRAAFAAFDGALGARIDDWRARLLRIAADAEALIDHDGEGDVADRAGEAPLRDALTMLAADMGRLAEGPSREELRAGIAVVLAGPPNSGKSSLLNALTSRDAALVTPIAGTTRDLIEVQLELGGRRIRLIDTAGLRDSDDPVELLGIARARQAAGAADLQVWLGDDEPPPAAIPTLAVHARCDVDGRNGNGSRLAVSARTGEGLAALGSWIAGSAPAVADDLVLNQRQRSLVFEARIELEKAVQTLDLLVVASHIRFALALLDRLTGRAGLEDVLDAVFSGFCIGK